MAAHELLAVPQARYQTGYDEVSGLKKDDRFEKIEKLLERVPSKPQKLEPLVWPWTEINVKQSDVAWCLLTTRGKRPAMRLIPHLPKMEGYARRQAVQQIVEAKPWDKDTRQAIIDLAGDASTDARTAALDALKEVELLPGEVPQLEGYLTRKTGDLRRGVLELLLKQEDKAAVASGTRLLAAKDANQRLAGLELLRLMTDAKRSVAECRAQNFSLYPPSPQLCRPSGNLHQNLPLLLACRAQRCTES